MSLLELFLIAVAVSMDAFAVAICKGLSMQKVTLKKALTVGLYFGIFQAGMPLIGYFLGVQFRDIITSIDHWFAFFLLAFIGVNMIKESRANEGCPSGDLGFKNMVILAFSTSIDALAVGITLAFLKVDVIHSVTFIGTVTFILSMVGVRIGNIFRVKYKSKAELVGGIVLVCIGLKILLEHTGVLDLYL
ncbi:manganese efflux pump MntP family protein [Anaerocolumna aminovalerica]|uniref:manganese efflux pump MntP n=1 Tax=Anaerocolumna aminovalerica TaxID=1527 RepID=UPI001C0F2F0E|nr:manganese efflux pump MntP family protein [Anaerocolumna aminovalerica]MBU5333902.1 manganese efflux pump MntP family protein [Anaerocolumna aminovalerica]